MAFNGRATQNTTSRASGDFLIVVLLLAFVMPFYFHVGTFRLSAYRLYLIALFIPVTWRWLSGRAGSICLPDFLLIFSSVWMAIALFINHGLAAQWEFAGILFLETVTPYLLGRVLITNILTFQVFVRWYFTIIIILLPFAILENFTGKPYLLDLFGRVINVYATVYQEPRLGLDRAQVSMPHPILFGVFCAPAFALAWYVLGNTRANFKNSLRSFSVGTAVFCSLSSGAFIAVLIQFFLISWDKIFGKYQKRWIALMIGFGIIYFCLELLSNRNAFQIIASELTFSKSSGYNRILIFNNAIDDILENPIFGIGFGYWSRPPWLGGSVDNFWLILTLRYGAMSFFLLLTAYLLILIQASRAQLSGACAQARTGYLISMLGLGIAMTTVHMWEATYCLFMFLLGSGVWFWNADNTQPNEDKIVNSTSNARKIRYTRFPQS